MARDERLLLIFFRSERSGPARRMESLLAHLQRKERARVRVHCVDVDKCPDVAERFRITEVPTLLLVEGCRVAGRIEGRATAPAIERMLEPHLAEAVA